jgi:hypothetical protein
VWELWLTSIGCRIEVSERLKFSVKPHGAEALPNCCGNLGLKPKSKDSPKIRIRVSDRDD